jgi:hypothetical protein
MSQLDLWSLAEICRVVGLSLSPESSLDPRRWEPVERDTLASEYIAELPSQRAVLSASTGDAARDLR